MTNQRNPAGRTPLWARQAPTLMVAMVAVAALTYVVSTIAAQNRPFELVIDRNSGVRVSASAGDAIDVVIDRALESSPAALGGILQERGYYKIQ